jgi:peptidoglycan-associated lipoprotein
MRQPVAVLALAVVAALALSCKKTPPPAPPAPVPVAPATPPPAPPAPELAAQADEYERLRQMSADEIDRLGLLTDIHFDYDKFDLREGDRQLLSKNAETLKRFDFIKITIEGHCDERGSVEYNLALGERRAKGAFDYLVSLGVAANRMKTVSYGKEVPLCQESNEDCWARNRRDHFAVTGKTK